MQFGGRLSWTLTMVLLGAGCTGSVASTSAHPDVVPPRAGAPGAEIPPTGASSPEMRPGSATSPGVGPGNQPTAACSANTVPRQLVRRLTRQEYDNTVLSLLGLAGAPAAAFTPDEKLELFDANAGDPVSALQVDQYFEAAETLAAQAISKLPTLVPCPPQSGDDDCARRFIASFGRRAFRRPLEAAEVTSYFGIYSAGKASGGFAAGVQMIIAGMLQSPHFLYHLEASGAGATAGTQTMTAHARAARLSYLLWDGPPDDTLAAAADSGALMSADELERQARRMLADPRATPVLRAFHRQWLGIERLPSLQKDQTLYPDFGPELVASMLRETDLLVSDVFERDGRLESLLAATHSFFDERLARLYGSTHRPMGAAREMVPRVTLDPSQRLGVLTHGSLLASHAAESQSSPILRGKFVMEHLFCRHLPPPPPGTDTDIAEPSPNVSTRVRFQMHRSNPQCWSCHELIDPIGFGFEHYDAIGRYRTKDGGNAVDANGALRADSDADGPFNGAIELARRLATSGQVRACTTLQMARYALSIHDRSELGCALDSVEAAFAASGFDLRALIVALVKSPAFVSYRL